MTTTASRYLGIGDDWRILVTYLNPPNSDGTDGAPINLTGSTFGGDLFFLGRTDPVFEMTVTNGGIVASNAAAGSATFLVPRSLTETAVPDNPGTTVFQNRLQIWLIDSLGYKSTIAVFPILVFNPRTVDPAVFLLHQPEAIAAAGMQGPPGPAGLAISVNGHTGTTQTVTASDVGAYTTAQADAAALVQALIFG